MMKIKWLWIFIALALGAAVYLGTSDSTKRSYINGLPGFNQMPNREYIMQEAAYVFKDTDRDAPYPYISSPNERPGLPESVDQANVGKRFGSLRLLGTLPIGTRFRIVSVRKDETSDDASITYEILLEDPDAHQYPRLDAYFIVDHGDGSTDTPPPVLSRFAAPRDKT